MLLWRFSKLLFVYKHKSRIKLKTVSAICINNDSRKVIGQEAQDVIDLCLRQNEAKKINK